MIDTHTHIYLEEFDEDRVEVVRRAREAGVERVILPNVDFDTVQAMHATNDLFPGYCRMAMGLHPTSVEDDYRERLGQVRELLFSGEYCAVGEIGLDLILGQDLCRGAERGFCDADGVGGRVGFAGDYSLPGGIRRNIGSVAVGRVPAFRGVFHSFTGSAEQVRLLRGTGDYYFGINGIVTFKNAHLEDMVREVGIGRILLETDAPYLAPVPYRGKRNEPSYLPYMAKRIAEILDITTAEVEEATTANAVRLFGEG